MENDPKTDLAIAGALFAFALVDTLMRKGILKRGDAFTVLEIAKKRCAVEGNHGAEKLIGDFHAKMSSGS